MQELLKSCLINNQQALEKLFSNIWTVADIKTALSYLSAVEKDNLNYAQSLFLMGVIFYGKLKSNVKAETQTEETFKPNYQKAANLLKNASNRGNLPAMSFLAWMYIEGIGVSINHMKAFKWFETASKAGYIPAMLNLACMYCAGLGTPKNYKMAYLLYEKASDLGSTRAMTKIAEFCQFGDIFDFERDLSKAIFYYEKAIAQNDTSAMISRASMHEEGMGGEIDYLAAKELYIRASQLGDGFAIYKLALLYENPKAGIVNYEESIRLLDKAINLGVKHAMYHRAQLYEKGLGDPVNYSAAKDLYLKAMYFQDGSIYSSAMYAYALLCETGNGDSIKESEIVEFYYRACLEPIVYSDKLKVQTALERIAISNNYAKFYLILIDLTFDKNPAEVYEKYQLSIKKEDKCESELISLLMQKWLSLIAEIKEQKLHKKLGEFIEVYLARKVADYPRMQYQQMLLYFGKNELNKARKLYQMNNELLKLLEEDSDTIASHPKLTHNVINFLNNLNLVDFANYLKFKLFLYQQNEFEAYCFYESNPGIEQYFSGFEFYRLGNLALILQPEAGKIHRIEKACKFYTKAAANGDKDSKQLLTNFREELEKLKKEQQNLKDILPDPTEDQKFNEISLPIPSVPESSNNETTNQASSIPPGLEQFEEKFAPLRRKIETLLKKGDINQPLYNYNYVRVAEAARELKENLEELKLFYFSGKSKLTKERFIARCEQAIKTAEIEFKKHRGWHGIHPFIRGLLGVLSVMTVVPAIAITFKYDYKYVFFTTPKTKSSEELEQFKSKLNSP